jgi:hypothetical protein
MTLKSDERIRQSYAQEKPIVENFIYRDTVGHPFPPLKNTLVIGFGHKARHGKDWAAKTIAQTYPGIKVIGFATALKAYCRVKLGMRVKDPALLQYIGTEVFRKENPDIFVRVLYDTLAEEQPPVVLIPDVRFLNEAAMVKGMGGFVVKVVRVVGDRLDYTPFVSADRDPQHPSEIALDDWRGWDRRIIAVSGNLKDLERQACEIFEWARWQWHEARVDKARPTYSSRDPHTVFLSHEGVYIDDPTDGTGRPTRVSESLRPADSRQGRTPRVEQVAGGPVGRPDVRGLDDHAQGGSGTADPAGPLVQGDPRR